MESQAPSARQIAFHTRTRVAIVHGASVDRSLPHDKLTALFAPLNTRVFSAIELGESGFNDLLSPQSYDLIALIGEADEFGFRRKSVALLRGDSEDIEPIVLAFVPKVFFKDARKYLGISDAVILSDVNIRNWPLEVSQMAYRFLGSLVIPSLLNIDLADVKRIAKGIGLAFSISDDDHEKIIAKLPRECLVARSAILHFSCKDDVCLSEVNSISNSVALKKGLANFEPQLNSHVDAKKAIRKVNVKIGIRIRSEFENLQSDVLETNAKVAIDGEKRIAMTAILFGI